MDNNYSYCMNYGVLCQGVYDQEQRRFYYQSKTNMLLFTITHPLIYKFTTQTYKYWGKKLGENSHFFEKMTDFQKIVLTIFPVQAPMFSIIRPLRSPSYKYCLGLWEWRKDGYENTHLSHRTCIVPCTIQVCSQQHVMASHACSDAMAMRYEYVCHEWRSLCTNLTRRNMTESTEKTNGEGLP